ncbi:hypothetical protein [Flavobacterium psychrolimnae]|uniref:DUF4760 domain-containing protein n=1 Tax=Flavobacterium psychrolimnae TaxID=249351 RepID=A0A366B358_9FLAO|nr:hypothetical protein [Flavobacterium psychrolimnae]RBN50624.1 hypothetical protein DR980_06910 [Flavobacterium psychrolimnae]
MIDWTEVLKVVLPIIAICISVISTIVAWKNTQKQIRVNRIEEIILVLQTLNGIYINMFWLLNDLKKLNIENTYELSEWETRAEKLFAMLKENVSTDGFKRLRVLLNAYLPNKKGTPIKIKLLAISALYYDYFVAIENKNFTIITNKYDSEKIPKPNVMSNYLNALENDLIKEMKLGFEGLNFNLLKKYRSEKFLKDLGIHE